MMINQELSDYIQKSRENKIPDEQIKRNLLQIGWSEQIVNDAFKEKTIPIPVPTPMPPQVPMPPSLTVNKAVSKSSMWDAFEHVLLFISLYTMATAIALILHTFVDKWLPGVQTDSYSYAYYNSDWQSSLLRGYTAALIVSLPVFSFLFLDLVKRMDKNPYLRTVTARRILIYITLVITFIIMLINVIDSVYTLLKGNITPNFFLHLIITLGVSGIIFTYYFREVREDRKLNV